MYADLIGNDKLKDKKPLDNIMKKNPKLLAETKELFYKKGMELGTRKVMLDYVWEVQFKRQFGLKIGSSKNRETQAKAVSTLCRLTVNG